MVMRPCSIRTRIRYFVQIFSACQKKKVNSSKDERGREVSQVNICYLKQAVVHLDFHQTLKGCLSSGCGCKWADMVPNKNISYSQNEKETFLHVKTYLVTEWKHTAIMDYLALTMQTPSVSMWRYLKDVRFYLSLLIEFCHLTFSATDIEFHPYSDLLGCSHPVTHTSVQHSTAVSFKQNKQQQQLPKIKNQIKVPPELWRHMYYTHNTNCGIY